MEILIVEDDYISRSLLKKMLMEMGHQVIEAENGRQAWEFLKERQLQYIITDWMMPEMNGLELCHKIRSQTFDRYVYVIMLTAKDRKTDLVNVFKAGADDYIPKPFDPEELRARVMTGMRIIDLEEGYNNLADTLIESRNKLRIVLDSLNEDIVSLDSNFNIVSVNQAFVERLHCHPNDVVGRNCFEICGSGEPPLCNSQIEPLITKVFDNSQPQHLLITDQKELESNTYKQIACLPILNENGQVIQVVVVSKDITEDRHKSEEIQSLNNQLIETSSQIETKNYKLEKTLKQLENTQAQIVQSEKMASIGQLAAGVAHEINNPTGFVSSNLKTLGDYLHEIGELFQKYKEMSVDLQSDENKTKFPQNVGEALENIKAFEKDIDIDFLMKDITDLIGDCREGTDRIKKIVRDLKDFAHPGEDRLQSVNINNGLDSTLNVVTNEIKYKATVHKDFDKIPMVRAFPQQLNQVFMNILLNAAQAIEEKGDIHVRTRFKDGFVEVVIRDNGCGISQNNISKIFDPFFTTKEVGKGTGLGMNIAYNIIQKHSGTITVSSEVSKGTAFTIRIPAYTG